MIPEILGIDLPGNIAIKAPRVDKLAMLKANAALKNSVRDRGSMEVDGKESDTCTMEVAEMSSK